MHTLLKYDVPIRKSEDKCLEDKLKKSGVEFSCNAIDQCTRTQANIKENLLRRLFEPVEYSEMGIKWIKRVSPKQSTPLEIQNLLDGFNRLLYVRSSRSNPICVIREDVLKDVMNELLRQVIIECPERGLLLNSVFEECKHVLSAYRTLLRFAEAFIGRKRVISQHWSTDRSRRIQSLETSKKELELQISELKQRTEYLERKNQEEKAKRDAAQADQIKFYKKQGENLRAQMDTSVIPSDK